MSELRWNPLLRTWTMVAANRKNRPTMPKDWCPFCPGEGKKVPPDYDVYEYDNDFPALTEMPEPPSLADTELYRSEENYGKCEVILYSPEHHIKFYELSTDHISRLIALQAERCEALSRDERIKYVFPFENKGEAVGVTMPHPHGQIYAFPHVPQKLQVELASAKEHYEAHGECLFCAMNREEKEFKGRLIGENESFLAYIPFFTDYPYGVFITAKRHVSWLPDLTTAERLDLARMLKYLTKAFDELFAAPFPYMMVYHQRPVNSPEYDGAEDYFHFHIEFYPPFREPNKIKYYASVEMGTWAAANTSSVEETAPELRQLYEQAEREDL